MILKNALIIEQNTDEGELFDIEICGGKIGRVLPSGLRDRQGADDCIDLAGKTVIPGLIDVHTHGIGGVDTMDADFAELCRMYALEGTTSVLPTTMTMGTESLKKVCDNSKEKLPEDCANLLGIHLEGPYISPAKKGAQNELYIKKPSVDEFLEFDNVKMITLAPEIEGSMDFIRNIASRGACIISLGHTECDCKTALDAIDCGASCLTHTFNAMPPLLHRAPGPIGAAVEKNIYAQIICDGIHVEKQTMLVAYRMFGADRLILISDSLQCACLPEGEYESGGLKVILKGDCARLTDGVIAGSCVSLLYCVKKAVELGIPFKDAVRMASRTPAEMLKIPKGRIEAGYDADLLILDGNMKLSNVMIGGKFI